MEAADLSPKGAATRQAIVATARELLVAEGYERLTMREVAQRCGIKLGNLQYYFPTRDALLITLIQLEIDKDIATVVGSAEGGNGAASVRAMVNELTERWRGDSGAVYTTLNMLARHHEEFRALYGRIYQRFYAAIEEAIRCALPDLPDSEYALRARLLTALIDGAPRQTGVSRNPAFRERLVEEACRIALE